MTLSELAQGTAAVVQVFGRRRRQACPRARTAGVQKAPGREVAASRARGWESSAMGILGWRRIRCRRDTRDDETRMPARGGGEESEEASRAEFGGCRRAPGAWIALNRVERDGRRRGASAMEGEGGGRRKPL